MARVRVAYTLSGSRDLQRALAELNDKMATAFVVDAARAGAEVVAAAAKVLAPVGETGRLQKSIKVMDEIDIGHRGATAYAGTEIWYAHFPEFGTIHMPAQSYLRKGADESGDRVNDAQAKSVSANIENLTRKYR